MTASAGLPNTIVHNEFTHRLQTPVARQLQMLNVTAALRRQLAWFTGKTSQLMHRSAMNSVATVYKKALPNRTSAQPALRPSRNLSHVSLRRERPDLIRQASARDLEVPNPIPLVIDKTIWRSRVFLALCSY